MIARLLQRSFFDRSLIKESHILPFEKTKFETYCDV